MPIQVNLESATFQRQISQKEDKYKFLFAKNNLQAAWYIVLTSVLNIGT